MKFEVNLDIEEGDILYFNEEEWVVVDTVGFFGYQIDVESMSTGRLESFSREDLEDNIKFSGRFIHVKEDYVSVF